LVQLDIKAANNISQRRHDLNDRKEGQSKTGKQKQKTEKQREITANKF